MRPSEATCHLLDHGDDVIAIEKDAMADTIDREHIALIYAIWERAKYH